MATKIEIEVTGNGNNKVSATNSKVQEYAKQAEIAMQEAQKSAELAQLCASGNAMVNGTYSAQYYANEAKEAVKELDEAKSDAVNSVLSAVENYDRKDIVNNITSSVKGEITSDLYGYGTPANPAPQSELGEFKTSIETIKTDVQKFYNNTATLKSAVETLKEETLDARATAYLWANSTTPVGNTGNYGAKYYAQQAKTDYNNYLRKIQSYFIVKFLGVWETEASLQYAIENNEIEVENCNMVLITSTNTLKIRWNDKWYNLVCNSTSTDSGYTGGKDVD